MTVLTGADTYFTNVDESISQTQWEACIDQAIDKINGYGANYGISIPNMMGTAGSKSWTGTSAEAGFIRSIAVLVYAQEYKIAGKTSQSFGIDSISHSSSSDGRVDELAREAAKLLSDFDITIG